MQSNLSAVDSVINSTGFLSAFTTPATGETEVNLVCILGAISEWGVVRESPLPFTLRACLRVNVCLSMHMLRCADLAYL